MKAKRDQQGKVGKSAPVAVTSKKTKEYFFLLHSGSWNAEPWNSGFSSLPLAEGSAGDAWNTYLAVRAYLNRHKIEEDAFYGFFPESFNQETGLSSDAVIRYVASQNRQLDLILFSPHCDLQCMFVNTIEEAEYFVPGFANLASQLYGDLTGSMTLPGMVMDVRHSVTRNNFVAKPRFWRDWLKFNQKIHALAEGDDGELKRTLNQWVNYAGKAALVKGLVVDRTASIMLATQPKWKTGNYPSFWLPFSKNAPFSGKVGIVDAVATDALKYAYREQGRREYLATYIAARRNFFIDRPAPFTADQLLAAAPAERMDTPGTALVDKDSSSESSMSLTDLLNHADRLNQSGKSVEAIQLYQKWLEKNRSPHAYVANFNLGCLLSSCGESQKAIDQFLLSLSLNPKLHQARVNLGLAYERQGKLDAAMAEWSKAFDDMAQDVNADITLKLHAINNMGRLLENRRLYADAEAMLIRSLEIKPDQSPVIHHLVHLRQKQCKWPIFEPLPGVSVEMMLESMSALTALSASNDPVLQLRIAQKFAKEKVRSDRPALAPLESYRHDRLRIAYLSSNFGMHAVSILTAELYELHDRSRFEIYGFCWSPEDNTTMRERVVRSMDHLIRVDRMSDDEVAQAIRNAEIDILVDLQGLTSGCRPNILAQRPAPVQITWLGFPGTTGLPGIDYVLADRYIIPESEACHFSEKPLYLPHCFQINDRKRGTSPPPARSQLGLPDDAFVFCAFNHNHKFTPELFSIWMNILRRTSGSVLWLLADNDQAHDNLLQVAKCHGIHENRLVFAPRVVLAEYMGRFPVADLFLDTLPFNGGTTASDALWMGLPILTCSGRTFASRMAGSLLHAIGAPELITTSLSEYEELAVSLASDRQRMREIRTRVEANRATHPLFDTPRFVRDLEAVYEGIAVKP